MEKMKIVVLAGGLSPERDVSLTSGASITRALRDNGHKAYLVDLFFGLPDAPSNLEEVFDLPDGGLNIDASIKTTVPDLEALKASRPGDSPSMIGPNVLELCRIADISFLALHGSIGEDGKLQATFDTLGIKYTGPNSLGCALSMDKLVAKRLFKANGVPTPRGTSIKWATKDSTLDELGYYPPLVVKPCDSGSSIGVYIVHSEEEYRHAVEESFKNNPDGEYVIEPFIKGKEYACGVIDGKALPLAAIIPNDGVFDYANKYQDGGAAEICPPSDLSAELQKEIQHYGEMAFEALNLDVYSRADFIIDDETGRFFCLEVNSLPGMTPASLLPKEAKAAGIPYVDLCELIIKKSFGARYNK